MSWRLQVSVILAILQHVSFSICLSNGRHVIVMVYGVITTFYCRVL